MNQYSYQPPCDCDTLSHMYLCSGMTYQEIAATLGVSVKPIQTAMRKFGIPARTAAKRDQWGHRNASWRGGDAGYAAFHRRLYREQEQRCEVCGTADPDKRYEWANLTGRYDDPSDYRRMCCSCHRRHDGVITNITGKSCGS